MERCHARRVTAAVESTTMPTMMTRATAKGVGHTELVRTEKMVLLKSSGVLARL